MAAALRISLAVVFVAIFFVPASAHAVGCMPCPPGPAPRHMGPYGGYDLWLGLCPPDVFRFPPDGLYHHGETTTHWDQYRGRSVVRYLKITATFSDTGAIKPFSPGHEYVNVFDVVHPAWGAPIKVGMGYPGPDQNVGRHQDGPLYLEFRQYTPHSVIAVIFYWMDASHHVLWRSPILTWRC